MKFFPTPGFLWILGGHRLTQVGRAPAHRTATCLFYRDLDARWQHNDSRWGTLKQKSGGTSRGVATRRKVREKPFTV